MTSGAPAWRLLLFIILSFSIVGCSQIKRGNLDDEKDPHVMEGRRRLAGKDFDGAIESFERALQSNPRNAAAHYALGTIYYQDRIDYPASIYHYQRYLKLQPDSRMATVIQQQIEASRRELAKTDSLMPMNREIQHEFDRMSQTNDLLRKRIQFLEAQLARGPQYITNVVTNYVKLPQFEHGGTRRLTQPAQIVAAPDGADEKEEAQPTVAAETPRRTAPAPQRATETREDRNNARRAAASRKKEQEAPERSSTLHQVRPGETMEVLARKFGVSVADLKAANPGSARGVRAGQKIKIPAK